MDRPTDPRPPHRRRPRRRAHGRLHIVAWREGSTVYWLTNTLTDALTTRQMIDLAVATAPFPQLPHR